MPCPTCGHTLGRLCLHDDMAFSHCERCGTAVIEPICPEENPTFETRIYRPKLVDRCRQFETGREMREIDNVFSKWHQLGIAEAINLPENRP